MPNKISTAQRGGCALEKSRCELHRRTYHECLQCQPHAIHGVTVHKNGLFPTEDATVGRQQKEHEETTAVTVGRAIHSSDWLGDSLSVRVPSLGDSGALPRLWDAAANQETLDRGCKLLAVCRATSTSLSPSDAAQAYRSPKIGDLPGFRLSSLKLIIESRLNTQDSATDGPGKPYLLNAATSDTAPATDPGVMGNKDVIYIKKSGLRSIRRNRRFEPIVFHR
ncbi:uncharacterized protein PADG_11920 [Paracoccidioides brasiliensis Pb18]|uniref:Uncharacterized protein n=1 Tax=Paracoccidioides brasiliensis (strain Pb18) TaxID=502780 RepID=A0A0A0HX10_PARBD|nr:uncharacterized protein PADG_11920 [Paracoccidioides brasiliensis Pb18]KGM91945.1 hypothetical protein PADG_11920 [Paracoccidioides brasiliensis Pb18]